MPLTRLKNRRRKKKSCALPLSYGKIQFLVSINAIFPLAFGLFFLVFYFPIILSLFLFTMVLKDQISGRKEKYFLNFMPHQLAEQRKMHGIRNTQFLGPILQEGNQQLNTPLPRCFWPDRPLSSVWFSAQCEMSFPQQVLGQYNVFWFVEQHSCLTSITQELDLWQPVIDCLLPVASTVAYLS